MCKFKINTKDDQAEDLGFAYLCLLTGTINVDEMREWVYYVIQNSDIEDIPTYFFELADIQSVNCIHSLEHTPYSNTTDIEGDAVAGIGYKRGYLVDPLPYDTDIKEKEALSALKKNPHILKRFKATFPFIKYDDEA